MFCACPPEAYEPCVRAFSPYRNHRKTPSFSYGDIRWCLRSRQSISSEVRGVTMKPLALAICDQEVNKRILAVPHKVREEVSDKEMWNHSEPRNVRVSLPRRADE